MRAPGLAVVAALLLLGPSAGAAPPPPERLELGAALQALHDWDTRRAAAWAAADPAALRRLYAPGSAAAAADVALLRRWRDAGLRVRAIRTQVFGARLLSTDGDTVRLWVLDRVAGGEVRDGPRVRPLRASRPEGRVLVLRQSVAGWRVVSVSASDSVPRSARP